MKGIDNKMSDDQPKKIADDAQLQFERVLIERGMLMSHGFDHFATVSIEEATPEELEMARVIFFSGAQYLLAMILDHCSDDADHKGAADRLRKIEGELSRWADEVMREGTRPCQ